MDQPTVLYPLTLPALLDYLLSTQSASSPTTLIICSNRTTFLRELASSTQTDPLLNQWLVPTLRNLATTQHVKLAFCASVQALLAYLTACDRSADVHVHQTEAARERLVLVNLLALHKPTSSFSAQGLSRTFAAAVDTALRMRATLHLVECQARPSTPDHAPGDEATLDQDEAGDEAVSDQEEAEHVSAAEQDPWDQHVSILNLSAQRFGSGAADRLWAGRTVKARRIAARWFSFQSLTTQHINREPG